MLSCGGHHEGTTPKCVLSSGRQHGGNTRDRVQRNPHNESPLQVCPMCYKNQNQWHCLLIHARVVLECGISYCHQQTFRRWLRMLRNFVLRGEQAVLRKRLRTFGMGRFTKSFGQLGLSVTRKIDNNAKEEDRIWKSTCPFGFWVKRCTKNF